MRKLLASAALVASLTMLAGCGEKEDSTLPTAEENAQLNNAAEMLDASADGMTADEDTPLGNGEQIFVEENSTTANDGSANSAGNAQ